MMAMWAAWNGYMGAGPVGAIVEADTEDEAREVASRVLHARRRDGYGNPDNYGDVKRIERLTLPVVGEFDFVQEG